LRISLNIDDKLALISTFESDNEEKHPQEKGGDRTPITKLDQYQVALLFDYLIQAGAVKNSIVNTSLAEELSKLTGFSKQRLRANCIPNIWQIKTGSVGNIPLLQKDPDINLKTVKNLIVEINNKIHEDLEKNMKLRVKS
jgi:hypothetical protein